MKFQFKTIGGDSLAMLAGGLLTLAFAPINLYVLAIIAPALLLRSWQNTSSTRAAWRGWLFGLGFFGTSISWVYVSIHVYGQTAVPLAGLLTVILIAGFAFYPALQGYCLNRLFPSPSLPLSLLAFPSSWVLFEGFRSWFWTGFPWVLLGYSQIDSPLRGFAPLLGTNGLSWLLALSAVLLVMIVQNCYRWMSFAALCILWGLGALLSLNLGYWTQPIGTTISTSLVQGNIAQEDKWKANQLDNILQIYDQLTGPQFDKSQLIVWPEAAIPLAQQDAADYLNKMSARAQATHTTLVLGMPVRAETTEQEEYYNAILAVGAGNGVYYKQHLVPFGEYLPFEKYLRGLINFFAIPMSNFIPGKPRQALLTSQSVATGEGYKLGGLICYEIAYLNTVLSQLPAANVLITVSDNSWFGDSFAPAQVLQIARMRALETGRDMILATNNGITAIIDARGEIRARVPQFIQTVLTGVVQPRIGNTPLVYLGLWPIFIFAIGIFLLAVYRGRV